MDITGETKRVLAVRGAVSRITGHLRHYLKDKPVEIIETDICMDDLENVVENEHFDLLILDIYIPQGDGLTLLERLRSANNDTRVVMYSELCTHMMIQAAYALDIDYYFVDGGPSQFVADMLWRIISYNDYLNQLPLEIQEIAAVTVNLKEALERDITDIIRRIGIPANIKGYQYLREAIMMSVQDVDNLQYITKMLYPSIAQKYHTNSSSVERAIRHAISISCARGDHMYMSELFRFRQTGGDWKPTNSQFIAQITDRLRIEYGLEEAV